MTDPTAAERIDGYMQSRADSIAELFSIADGEGTRTFDGDELDEEQAGEYLDELPLSVEILRHVKITLGTGGPADWLDAELDAGGDIRTLYYHFADWFDHASTPVDKDSPLWRFAERFAEYAGLTEQD